MVLFAACGTIPSFFAALLFSTLASASFSITPPGPDLVQCAQVGLTWTEEPPIVRVLAFLVVTRCISECVLATLGRAQPRDSARWSYSGHTRSDQQQLPYLDRGHSCRSEHQLHLYQTCGPVNSPLIA
ncbi:hypothetical protein C8Q76DRAFT_440625 [Earliella scabrosa]|nr:hypothetical protein C8Q76DRAFT_440625 [Earliella scabrosa]